MTVTDPSPASHAFGVRTDEVDGRVVLRLAGELTSEVVPDLRTQLDHLDVRGDVVLDLEGLTFVDSSGLGCIYRLQQRVADAGGLLEARNVCPHVRHAMQLVQLNRVIAVLD